MKKLLFALSLIGIAFACKKSDPDSPSPSPTGPTTTKPSYDKALIGKWHIDSSRSDTEKAAFAYAKDTMITKYGTVIDTTIIWYGMEFDTAYFYPVTSYTWYKLVQNTPSYVGTGIRWKSSNDTIYWKKLLSVKNSVPTFTNVPRYTYRISGKTIKLYELPDSASPVGKTRWYHKL